MSGDAGPAGGAGPDRSGPDPDGLGPGRLAELAPLLRRIESLDADALVRLRVEDAADGRRAATLFAALPFGVLVSRTVPSDAGGPPPIIGAAAAGPMLAWLLGHGPPPPSLDGDWRGALPPARGWRRLEVLPDAVIRDRVRAGALAVKELSSAAGPDEQVRQPAIDALLDSVVLTVVGEPADSAAGAVHGPLGARITLRTLSALVRMAFVPRDSSVAVDTCRGWHRVVGSYGAAYASSVAPGVGRTLPGLLPVVR